MKNHNIILKEKFNTIPLDFLALEFKIGLRKFFVIPGNLVVFEVGFLVGNSKKNVIHIGSTIIMGKISGKFLI